MRVRKQENDTYRCTRVGRIARLVLIHVWATYLYAQLAIPGRCAVHNNAEWD